MTERILRLVQRRRMAATCLLSITLAVPALLLASTLLERRGASFYAVGRELVGVLADLAEAVEAADPRGIAARYSPSYRSAPPSLSDPLPEGERDGVLSYRFVPRADTVARDGAVEEWMRYLARFDSIDRVELHVHRLERWHGDERVATVRFELIGTPAGEPRAGIDRGLFRMRFEATSGDAREGRPRIVGAELLEGSRTLARRPHFDDVAAAAGVDFENRYYPPFLDEPLEFGMIRYGPGGITAVDYDGDGLYDLFVPDGVESRLFRNRGDGGFDDVTAEAGLSGLSGVSVALFADFDDDGLKDLFVSRTFEPNQLFHARRLASGAIGYTDVTASSGLTPDCCTTVASWGDYDGDGDLDLYVGRYLDPRERIPTTFYARNGEPNKLYRNDGGGVFTDVTDEAGVGDTGLCLGTAFVDYDGDGRLDLWVANDFGRKTLYRNLGGTFEDVTVETGTLAYGAGMSSTVGDYDNDGHLDLYVAHIRSEHAWYAEAPTVRRYMANSFRQGVWRSDMPLYWDIFRRSGTRFVEVFQQMASGNTLLRNDGGGPGAARFEDTTWDAGANPPGWFWGTSFADFDNDGWLDLYAANGWVYGEPDTEIELEFLNDVVARQDIYKTGALFDPEHFRGRSWHGWERNRHLRNEGPGEDGRVRFTEVGRAVGTDLLLNSRGIAVADFWNRGVLDIAVAASADRHALLANRLEGLRPWLSVEVAGAGRALLDGSNRDGVGARVTVTAAGTTQLREVVLGDGYGSQNSLRQHFGLGTAETVDELTVRWPRSGRVQTFRDVAPNRVVRVTEGRATLEELTLPAAAPPPGIDTFRSPPR